MAVLAHPLNAPFSVAAQARPPSAPFSVAVQVHPLSAPFSVAAQVHPRSALSRKSSKRGRRSELQRPDNCETYIKSGIHYFTSVSTIYESAGWPTFYIHPPSYVLGNTTSRRLAQLHSTTNLIPVPHILRESIDPYAGRVFSLYVWWIAGPFVHNLYQYKFSIEGFRIRFLWIKEGYLSKELNNVTSIFLSTCIVLVNLLDRLCVKLASCVRKSS